MNKDQNGFGLMGIIVVVITIVLIGAVGWLFWQNVVKPDTNNNPAASGQPSPSPVSLDTPNVTSLD